MRLVSFEHDGLRAGLLSCRGLHEVPAATVLAELARGPAREAELGALHALGDVVLLPPVRPAVLVGVDDNFGDQPRPRRGGLAAQRVAALDGLLSPGFADDAWIYLRDPASIVAPPAPLLKPPGCDRLSCGVSLVLVVGSPAYQLNPSEAAAHLAGVAVALDVVRCDLPPGHAALARSYATHTPIGPVLVTIDEAPLEVPRRLELRHNGLVVQRSSTAAMLSTLPELFAAITRRLPLEPGDAILTGTPGGTAADRGEGWLEEGDELVAEIEGVGRLELEVAGAH